MALVAHLAASRARAPVLHVFDSGVSGRGRAKAALMSSADIERIASQVSGSLSLAGLSPAVACFCTNFLSGNVLAHAVSPLAAFFPRLGCPQSA